MQVRILGSAAGGGFPQWNCRCANCEAARTGAPGVRPRTQSSVALSINNRSWLLLNVSPDIRQQILAFPPLGPPEGSQRGQGIVGCILTDAELDHTAGLLFLREGGPFSVFSTALVRRWLNQAFPVEPLLANFARPGWRDLPLGTSLLLTEQDLQSPLSAEKSRSGSGRLLLRPFEIERHVPRFVAEEVSAAVGSVIGLQIADLQTGGTLVYAPCVGSLTDSLVDAAETATALLIDGTFWSNEEPLQIGKRTALEMGHIPVSGPQGSLAWLAELPIPHRMYIHINNTNPMLNEHGPEFQIVTGKGVRVGADGDMFEL